ncbi:hypothetical protein [Glaciecola sp. 1036]|uniref:hypothetical protein n=1 Tax=Alteromonadaceae TaxID=72275 RepID=UPI003D094058
MKYLVLLSLFFANLAFAETSSYGNADIHLSITTEYSFEMSVVNQTRSGIRLSSDKVFKSSKIEFKPDRSLAPDSPYQNFVYSDEPGKWEDKTVKLSIVLDDFYAYDDSYWFKQSKLSFQEKFAPHNTISNAVNHVLNNHNVTNKEERDVFVKQHIYLSSSYALDDPYSAFEEVDKINGENYNVRNLVDTNAFTQDVNIVFKNGTFFANQMGKKTLDSKYVESFYMGPSYSFLEQVYKSLIKNNHISYTYLFYSLTNILPIEIPRFSGGVDGTKEKFELVTNQGTNQRGLYCAKKSSAKFECKITVQFNSTFRFPDSVQVSKYPFPKFVIEYLSTKGFTDEKLQQGVAAIDLDALKSQAERY